MTIYMTIYICVRLYMWLSLSLSFYIYIEEYLFRNIFLKADWEWIMSHTNTKHNQPNSPIEHPEVHITKERGLNVRETYYSHYTVMERN